MKAKKEPLNGQSKAFTFLTFKCHSLYSEVKIFCCQVMLKEYNNCLMDEMNDE